MCVIDLSITSVSYHKELTFRKVEGYIHKADATSMRSLLPVLGPRGPPGVQRRQRQQRSQDHLADLSRTLGLVGSCLCAGIPAKPAPHRYGYAPTSCLS